VVIQQIYDGGNYGPVFGGGNDLRMWDTNNYALSQQTNGYTNVGTSYDQPAGGAYALSGVHNNFTYTDFVAFHVKRVQAGCASFQSSHVINKQTDSEGSP
jgi:hypothetical protein